MPSSLPAPSCCWDCNSRLHRSSLRKHHPPNSRLFSPFPTDPEAAACTLAAVARRSKETSRSRHFFDGCVKQFAERCLLLRHNIFVGDDPRDETQGNMRGNLEEKVVGAPSDSGQAEAGDISGASLLEVGARPHRIAIRLLRVLGGRAATDCPRFPPSKRQPVWRPIESRSTCVFRPHRN